MKGPLFPCFLWVSCLAYDSRYWVTHNLCLSNRVLVLSIDATTSHDFCTPRVNDSYRHCTFKVKVKLQDEVTTNGSVIKAEATEPYNQIQNR